MTTNHGPWAADVREAVDSLAGAFLRAEAADEARRVAAGAEAAKVPFDGAEYARQQAEREREHDREIEAG